MVEKNDQKTFLLVIPGVAFQVGGIILASLPYHPTEAMLGRFLMLGGTFFLLNGLSIYAQSKGRKPAWSLFGFLSLIGLIIVARLKSKPIAQQATVTLTDEEKKSIKKSRRPGIIFFIIGLFWGAGFAFLEQRVEDAIQLWKWMPFITIAWFIILIVLIFLAVTKLNIRPPERKRMINPISSQKKVFAVSLIVVTILCGAGYVLGKIYLPWPKLLSHVRLKPKRPHLSEEDVTEDNAYFYIRQLSDLADTVRMGEADEEYARFAAFGWKENEYSALEQFVSRNGAALELCEKAAAISACQVATVDFPDLLLPYLPHIRSMVRAMRVRAEREAAAGNWESVLHNYRTALVVSDHISRGGTFISSLVNYVCVRITCESIRRIALEYTLPTDTTRSLIALLKQLDENFEPFAEFMRYDCLRSKASLRQVFQPLPMKLLLFILGGTPKQMGENVEIVYSYVIDVASGPYAPERLVSEFWFFEEESVFKSKTLLFFAGDPLGRICLSMLIPAYLRAYDHHFRVLTHMRATQVILAVRLYQEQHNGEMPVNLSALVPAYIDAIPQDPFLADAPLRFHKRDDGWVVYSVGSNRVDDGGIRYAEGDEEHTRDELDICFPSDEIDLKIERYRRKKKKRDL